VPPSRALRFQGPGRLELDTVDVPEPAAGDALVRMRCCGICGTDLHIYEDGWRVSPGQVLGHEFAGEIVSAPDGGGLREGQRVIVNPMLACGECSACRADRQNMCFARRGTIGITEAGAFADYVLVRQARLGRELLEIPDGVSDAAAALTEPLAVGLHAVAVSELEDGDCVVVLGAGMIGLCVTRWLAVEGAQRIVAVDPLKLRRDAALLHGATAALDPVERSYEQQLRDLLRGARRSGRADVVIDCAGAQGILEQAVSIARPGGRLTLAAVQSGQGCLSAMRMLDKELTARGAMAYTAPDFARSLDHVVEHADGVETLISDRFELADVVAGFHRQLDRENSVKVMISNETR
jgi:(R,R)-butanediol dehydrogenase/meso-butanediol dehydrogenase/diacetyl reductase